MLKKFFILSLSFIFFLVFSACSKNNSNVDTSSLLRNNTISRNPSFSSNSTVQSNSSGNAAYLTEEQAKQIALAHAQLSENSVTFESTKLSVGESASYTINFYKDDKHYSCCVNAVNGSISSFEETPVTSNSSASSTNNYISEISAVQIVLGKVVGATTSDVVLHLNTSDAIAIYEGSVYFNRIQYDFKINALTGDILDWYSKPMY